jgi:hypothetical protein
MHRWYQVSAEKAKLYEETGLLHPGRGYFYEASDGIKMVELHIDEIPENIIRNKKNANPLLTEIFQQCPFGGNLSVRMAETEKPLLAFGHDKCIFWQFIFTGKAWKGTKGELAIIPKDEGNYGFSNTKQSVWFWSGTYLGRARHRK